MPILRRCLFAACGVWAGNALAQQTATSVPGVSGATFVQALLGLVLVIAVLLAAVWLMKRLGAGSGFGNPAGMRIVSGLSVGPRERILLLEIGESWVIVGVTGSEMRTLHTMAKMDLPTNGGTVASPPFANWLKQITEHKRATP